MRIKRTDDGHDPGATDDPNFARLTAVIAAAEERRRPEALRQAVLALRIVAALNRSTAPTGDAAEEMLDAEEVEELASATLLLVGALGDSILDCALSTVMTLQYGDDLPDREFSESVARRVRASLPVLREVQELPVSVLAEELARADLPNAEVLWNCLYQLWALVDMCARPAMEGALHCAHAADATLAAGGLGLGLLSRRAPAQ